MKWTKQPAFINRKAELNFLNQCISEKPENLLFIYGPKSSGKTTLLSRFTQQHKSNKEIHIKSLNLREVLIGNYHDFLRVFFSVYEPDLSEQKIQSKISAGIFSITSDIKKKILTEHADPFIVMKKELAELSNKGKRPIIIIDELQGLEQIYMNGQRELIKELFNFFVAMTKESHLCHVLIASSDGFFIERIYSDSRLSKTSKFYEVDYLTKQDVVYWLNNLKKESRIENLVLTPQQIETIWHYFGGSMWEINSFLSDLLHNAAEGRVKDDFLEKSAEKEIVALQHRFENYLGKHYDYDLFSVINDILSTSEYFYEKDLIANFERAGLKEELGSLAQNNMFSYNPCTGQYRPQGHSMKLGLNKFCKEL
jgi:uncharacterized protein